MFFRCIIAMGLDKQPSPPKKKVTDENEEKKEDPRKDNVSRKLSETSSAVGIGEKNKNSVSQSSSVAGEGKESEEMEVETSKNEARSDAYSDERERNQRCASENGRSFAINVHTQLFSQQHTHRCCVISCEEMHNLCLVMPMSFYSTTF